MKRIIILLLIAAATVWFYYWYVQGVNLLLNEPMDNPPPYTFATRLPGKTVGEEPTVVAWQKAADMPTPRTGASAAAVGDTVYVIGGIDGLARTTDVVEAFDVKLNYWHKAAPLPTALHHAAVAVVEDVIYVFGGLVGLGNLPVDTVYAYDHVGDEWRSVGTMPRAFGSAAAAVYGGKVHLIGGETPAETLGQHLVYDPKENSWDRKADLESGRDRAAATVAFGKIWLVGGRGGSTLYNVNTISVYDPARNVWLDKTPMNSPRSSLAVGSSDRIFAIGGEAATVVLGSVEAYDPDTDSWVLAQPMPHPRFGSAFIQSGSRLFIIGGSARPAFSVSSVNEVYALPLEVESVVETAVPEITTPPRETDDPSLDDGQSDVSGEPPNQAY